MLNDAGGGVNHRQYGGRKGLKLAVRFFAMTSYSDACVSVLNMSTFGM
jgi:hypothetical protein